MITANPNIPLLLWVSYSENGTPVSELTDLTIIIYDHNDNIVLNTTVLTESLTNAGFYSYSFDLSSLAQETILYVYFKKNGSIINIEEYMIDSIEDNIGRAF